MQVAASADADGGWSLTVCDDGDGIPPELRDGLLDPRRAHARGRDRNSTGLGFGLATCSRIAQRHGGTLTVEHRDPGTCFTLEVPAARDGGLSS